MTKQHSRRASFAAAVLMLLTSLTADAVPILEFAPTESSSGVGDSFSVHVFGSDFIDLFAYQILISYDPTILSPDSITEGSFLSSAGTTAFFGDFLDGNIVLLDILLDATTGASGSGVLATLGFTGLASGVSPLVFSDFVLQDSVGGLIEADARNGTATIPEPSSLALLAIGLLALGGALRSRLWLPRT